MRRVLPLLLLAGCADPPPPTPGASGATYVGRVACVSCHQAEHDAWAGSHHDLAMDVATAETVLGDFDDAAHTQFGVTSTFRRDGNRFIVRTEGPDGGLRDYDIAYTFGVTPLQQYLVPFPGGRYQTLPLCWDTRPESEGGQRWFHIYPDEKIPPGDALHWTGLNQNWNYQCAECHSTDLHKNYDALANTFDTTWSEIDVSCEACHGPGSAHVAAGGHGGLQVTLGDDDGGQWLFEPDAPTASRTPPRTSHAQIETCARCHARRSEIHEPDLAGRPLLDTHRLALLETHLYHPDGQILAEVYVYGSFIQSRMHREGVTCGDCHEPHGLGLIADGNTLCGRCHTASVFDTPAHHFHQAGTPGSFCVDCHMPARTYMVVDDRRDHSMRIPRPDLTIALGAPNACNGCHDDRPATWALAALERRYGSVRRASGHYGLLLHRGRASGTAAAAGALRALAADPDAPGIARATAVAELVDAPSAETEATIAAAARDDDPLVRAAAGAAIEGLPPQRRMPVGGVLLDDPVRAVRVAAARSLAGAGPETPRLAAALDEVIAADMVQGERPEAHVRIGNLMFARGRPTEAETAYRHALALDAAHLPARVNLADLYRATGRDAEGETLLRETLTLHPEDAAAHHALGLLLVRVGRLDEAVTELEVAARLAPDTVRFTYVYAIALDTTGRRADAVAVLERLLERAPDDADVRATLEGLRSGQ